MSLVLRRPGPDPGPHRDVGQEVPDQVRDGRPCAEGCAASTGDAGDGGPGDQPPRRQIRRGGHGAGVWPAGRGKAAISGGQGKIPAFSRPGP